MKSVLEYVVVGILYFEETLLKSKKSALNFDFFLVQTPTILELSLINCLSISFEKDTEPINTIRIIYLKSKTFSIVYFLILLSLKFLLFFYLLHLLHKDFLYFLFYFEIFYYTKYVFLL